MWFQATPERTFTNTERGVADGSVFFDDTHYGALRLGVARGELYGESFVAQGGSSATPVDTFLLKKTCSK